MLVATVKSRRFALALTACTCLGLASVAFAEAPKAPAAMHSTPAAQSHTKAANHHPAHHVEHKAVKPARK